MLRILTAIMALLIVVSIVAPKANAASPVCGPQPAPMPQSAAEMPAYADAVNVWIKCDYNSRHPIVKAAPKPAAKPKPKRKHHAVKHRRKHKVKHAVIDQSCGSVRSSSSDYPTSIRVHNASCGTARSIARAVTIDGSDAPRGWRCPSNTYGARSIRCTKGGSVVAWRVIFT